MKNYTESDDQLTLTWQDNSTNEDNFGIERKTGTSGTHVQIALAPANARSYPDSNVSRGVTYCYRVDVLTAPEHQIILLTKHVRLFHKLMLINTDQLGGAYAAKDFQINFLQRHDLDGVIVGGYCLPSFQLPQSFRGGKKTHRNLFHNMETWVWRDFGSDRRENFLIVSLLLVVENRSTKQFRAA